MIRRLCTLLLVLACAFAPALPALEIAAKSDECGCAKCCCPHDCAPPPATPRAPTTLTVVGAVEARARVGRPARRSATTAPRPISRFQTLPVSSAPAQFALRAIEARASVPLFQAHCTFLI